MNLLLILVAIVGAVLGGLGSPPKDPAPRGEPTPAGRAPEPVEKPAPVVAGFASADEVLEALETADRGIGSLVAQVLYDRELALAGDRQQRVGMLYFVSRPGEKPDTPDRRFAIDFSELAVGGRRQSERQTFIFDGQWLLEKHWSEKEYVRRQVVPPGERFDPLRIGEGPMPIPIGQRRADILARYEVEMLPPEAGLEDEELKAFAARSVQLRLKPRDERDEFREVRLWYRREPDGRLLPRMARTVNHNDDVAVVRLVSPRLNEPVPEEVLDTRPPADWNGTIQPYRGSSSTGGG